ncbi:nucleotide-diphospho-sugar transferase [Kickxella alabastrina]|uniref:nucleotide-diphospho-sugar transferase n=1 Tax=Kickxella alabastrina TaxID=61397 RepID=UPI002220EBFA|nr:nucleotide-diphospho-sugar transferase [Kickxella alabastrina]KAI7833155.1 nucleotide-diphospho-sugar transferase [Kickxella alabastrina]
MAETNTNTSTSRKCFATLLTTDSYLHGALTLAASLRTTNTKYEIICLVSDKQLSAPSLDRLSSAFDRIINVPALDTKDKVNLALLKRPDLGSTVTKIAVWSLTEYQRIVFLDADTLVLQPIDSLLDNNVETGSGGWAGRPNGGMRRKGLLGAAPDLGWPDCFNSGVFVAQPAEATHEELLKMLYAQGSFDGGDQGLLNEYFSDWSRADHTRRLSFSFNTTSSSFYTYAPAFARFSNDIKVVHFIGPQKPWKCSRPVSKAVSDSAVIASNGSSDFDNGGLGKLVEKWWSVHDAYVSTHSTNIGAIAKVVEVADVSLKGMISESAKETDARVDTVAKASVKGLASSHVTDNAWKRDNGGSGGSSSNNALIKQSRVVGVAVVEDDSWGVFTPAADFTLQPTISRRKSNGLSPRSN